MSSWCASARPPEVCAVIGIVRRRSSDNWKKHERSGGEDIPNTEVQRRIRKAVFIMELIVRKWPEKTKRETVNRQPPSR